MRRVAGRRRCSNLVGHGLQALPKSRHAAQNHLAVRRRLDDQERRFKSGFLLAPSDQLMGFA